MLPKQLTKQEKLQEKLNNETNPYKKEQLEQRIELLKIKEFWNSKNKGTYRKEKK